VIVVAAAPDGMYVAATTSLDFSPAGDGASAVCWRRGMGAVIIGLFGWR
jgi:hypothetical protein